MSTASSVPSSSSSADASSSSSSSSFSSSSSSSYSGRVVNLNAGPAALPLSVLQQAQAELLNWHETGMSVMEMSHRSKQFESILAQTTADLRELLQLPSNYQVIYKQGGGTSQFSAIALNFLGPDQTADYIITGAWSKAAAQEAARFGRVNIVASSESSNFNHIPDPSTWKLTPNAAYLFYCHNETVHGSAFSSIPNVPSNVPLICDMSSSFMSAPIPDINKYALIFAGAQKNIGPAGLTIIIIRDDLLAKSPVQKNITPIMYNYKLLAEKESMYNTPPCFSIYMTGLVLSWLKREGGLAVIGQRNAEKAAKLYEAIDTHKIYSGVVDPVSDRSVMNVTFLVGGGDAKLTDTFVKQAEQHGIVGIAGHRSVGGLRASLYNATTPNDVEQLVTFMKSFAQQHTDVTGTGTVPVTSKAAL